MARPPNILFVLVDDMGYGDFGVFNDGSSRTPRLDALVAESVCLTQHYSGSPVCNPSRASLLTGRYPQRTGSIDTLEWRGFERLALREITLADILQGAGYVTGLVGKWHLGSFDPRYRPTRRGFDEAVCFRGGMHDYYQWRLEFQDTIRRADGRYLTDVWTDEAVGFLQRHISGDKPFFLHVTFNAPHTPLQAPEEEVRPFAETGKFTRGLSTLYGMIARMDKGLGRILEELDRQGAADNTLVVFTSDNGPQFSGAGTENSIVRFNCGFHGSKGSTYEGGVRVPALVRWPAGGLGSGRRIDSMVHISDWFSTLLAAAGCQPPTDRVIDGWNVLPVLRGESDKVNTRRFWQWNRYSPLITSNAAVRDGDWKLVRPAIREAMAVPDGNWLKVSMYEPEYFIENGVFPGEPPREVPSPPPPELYNIAEDPLEQANLTDKYPDRAAKLLRDLETWFEEVEAERASIDD